jgi:hypothetical protein
MWTTPTGQPDGREHRRSRRSFECFVPIAAVSTRGLPQVIFGSRRHLYHWNTVSPRVGINYQVNSSNTIVKRTTAAITKDRPTDAWCGP